MTGDQRISQAFDMRRPAVQTLDARMSAVEAQVQQALQTMQGHAASAFQTVEQRIIAQEQQFGQAMQAMKDAITQL